LHKNDSLVKKTTHMRIIYDIIRFTHEY
jgi:hypothetical protein